MEPSRAYLDPGQHQQLAAQLFTDPLTGLGNQKAYADFLEKEKPGVHVRVDPQGLGEVNRLHGFDTGDGTMRAFGKALLEALQESVGSKGKAFRLGGTAHAHVPDYASASRLVRKLREKVEAIAPIGGTHVLTLSAGLGPTPEHSEKALHEAKSTAAVEKHVSGGMQSHVHSLQPEAEGEVLDGPLLSKSLHDDFAQKVLDTASSAPETSRFGGKDSRFVYIHHLADHLGVAPEHLPHFKAALVNASRKGLLTLATADARTAPGADPGAVQASETSAGKTKYHFVFSRRPAAPAPALDLKTFANQVHAATAQAPANEGYGDKLVFIHHVARRMGVPASDLPRFKQRLVDAHREGHLKMARADLVEAMDPADVQASEAVHPEGATFHFIRRAG